MRRKKEQGALSLREKYLNTEFCLVRIFLYLVLIQENTDQGKLGIWTLFTQCVFSKTKNMAKYNSENI